MRGQAIILAMQFLFQAITQSLVLIMMMTMPRIVVLPIFLNVMAPHGIRK
jgi:hypothetical protein